MTTPDQIDLAHASAFRLGPITVEPGLRQVTAARSETLEPRVMQVLVVLAMANGGIVSRDDLVRQCWEGRIVGDDSINRVIARLRKLADEHGDGAFRIETITKVGYRLVGQVVLTTGITAPPLASDMPAATPGAAKPRQRRWAVMAAGAAGLAGITALVWNLTTPAPAPLQASLRIGEFKTLSADVPATLGTALQNELLIKFNEMPSSLVSIAKGPPAPATQAWVMTGTIRKIAADLHFVINLSQEGTGATPLSLAFDRPASAGDASLAMIAGEAAPVMACLMRGTVMGQTEPLPDATVQLFARYCDAARLGLPGRPVGIALMRQVVKTSPDFANGWAALGSVLAGQFPEASKVAGNPQYDEAMAALATAERLGLESYVIPNTRARLLPSRDIAGREKLLRQSAEKFATESNGTAPFNLANLLWNAGRLNDAIAANRLALQLRPNFEEGTSFQANMLRTSGQIAESDAMIRKLDAEWPESEHGRRFRITDALLRRDFAVARTAIAGASKIHPAMRKAMDAALVALQRGDKAAAMAAADRLIALCKSPETRSGFAMDMLAALGRDSDALNIAKAMIYGPQVPSTKILFSPALARARALPAFAETARQLGLIDYWRTSGHPPDFCAAADAPPLCATLKPA